MPRGQPKKFSSARQLIELWAEFNDGIRQGGFADVPTQTNFCRYLSGRFASCDRKTIYNALNKYFPAIKGRFEQIQADTIAEGAMLGHYQSTMSIFALKNWCRWRDQPPEEESENGGQSYTGIPAAMIAPAFQNALLDILRQGHGEYVFPGGRGSTKSSFVSLVIPDLLMRHEDMSALILRQVSNTLKDSVYAQICWGIRQLGLESEFQFRTSPLEIIRKKTGQKIFFRGCDDPLKLKSVKPEHGYIGILWFEELDQFRDADVRSVEQSALRGGDLTYTFKTFNPPKSAQNWANLYLKKPADRRLVTPSDYRSVPPDWLGRTFLELADFLKETNPVAYANEYLGEANGTGGAVFDNVELREIPPEERERFDNILNGVDWGWYPDLFAFVRVHYAAAQHTLYIWQEYTCNKRSNEQTAATLRELGLTSEDIVTCDSAEQKSVGDYRAFGLAARAAEKGPHSRDYSYKWLQSLRRIVIDPAACPVAAQEFLEYEYDRDKDGNVISGYPDGNDHVIDAVRYATERIWKRRGR